MINVIYMTAQPDDVSIDTISTFSDDAEMRIIHKYVKDFATSRAEGMILESQGRVKPSVEISENEEGLPHASIYVDNRIEQQVFATKR